MFPQTLDDQSSTQCADEEEIIVIRSVAEGDSIYRGVR